MANTGECNAQPPHESVQFSPALDTLSLSLYLGDNGVPSDVCELFEGKWFNCLTVHV